MNANDCVQSFADILSGECPVNVTVSASIEPSFVVLTVTELNEKIMDAVMKAVDSPDRVRGADVVFGVQFR